MAKSIRRRVYGMIRERLCKRMGIPFSRFGVPPGIVEFLPVDCPINYVDVGASSGFFAEAINRHYGIARGILVEPQPQRCKELRDKFGDSRFSVHHCALAEKPGRLKMDVLNFDFSSSILPVNRQLANLPDSLDLGIREKIECDVQTLDCVVSEANLADGIDLLKIDVQGAELMVLRGAEKTLERVRYLFAEISFVPLYEGSCLFHEVYGFLRDHNFRLLSLREGFRGTDQELFQGDALFAR